MPCHLAAIMDNESTVQRPAFTRLREYVNDVRTEMKKVSWPPKQEVYGTTVMVLLTTFLFGFYFWICDQAFSNLVRRALSYLLHRA